MADKLYFDTQRVKDYMAQADLGAMDLVRLCSIAVSSAYIIDKGKPLSDLNVLYKVYVGLKNAGHDVTFAQLTGIE
jgi:hypothetical protein